MYVRYRNFANVFTSARSGCQFNELLYPEISPRTNPAGVPVRCIPIRFTLVAERRNCWPTSSAGSAIIPSKKSEYGGISRVDAHLRLRLPRAQWEGLV